jgi:L-fucose isomerase-like protein
MEKVKIGFVPSHRPFFDEKWAIEMRKRALNALSKIDEVALIAPDESLTQNGLVSSESDAQNVIKLFRNEDVVGIIFGTMTFGEEIPAITIASSFANLPILVFGTKEGPFTSEGGRRSDSFCGTLSLTSGLYRRKIPFSFLGIIFPEEEAFLNGVSNFARACAIVKGFKEAKIGMIGPRPEGFETCAFNEVAMINSFKQRLIPISLADIFQKAEAVDDEEAQKIIQEIKSKADTSRINENSLMKIAKLEYALEQFAKEKGISAMGIQCWTAMQTVYGVSPCLAMGRLTEKGIMASCEADIYGALTMLIQYLASLKTTPPHFIDWTIQHQEKENTFLAWHCGNAPMSLACPECRIHIRAHSILEKLIGAEVCQGTGEFQLKPGPVTLCRLAEYDGKFKMLIAKGEVKKSFQDLRGSWSWVEVKDLKKLYRTLVEEGFIHHASMIHGDYIQPISEACKFLNIDTIIVE